MRGRIFAWCAFFGVLATPNLGAEEATVAPTNAGMSRGAYLAVLGDCAGCHTQPGKPAYSGGVPLGTPFGTIYTANITPDKDTGIGGWTDAQFYNALHNGIDAKGGHLYPAFPYPYFQRISREDSDTLHAYLNSLPAVHSTPPANKMPFPFNIRFLIALWNAVNFDHTPTPVDTGKSPEWNRGAYLVWGPGHCGACHTPKNWMGGDKNDVMFTGGVLDNWATANLTSDPRSGLQSWTAADIAEYLKTGRNTHTNASGSMQLVIQDSTSQMTDDDRAAIAAYLKDLPAGGVDKDNGMADAAAMKAGGQIFADTCAACHRAQGTGEPEFFPPLVGNATAQNTDPTSVIRVILEGARSVATKDRPTPAAMPAFNWKLNDQEVADVATYVRNAWGNRSPSVSAIEVKKIRDAISQNASN
jgi:mono/diheme cytochrome c family protein